MVSKAVAGVSVSQLGKENYTKNGHVISIFSVSLTDNHVLISDASRRLKIGENPIVYGIVTNNIKLKKFSDDMYRVYSISKR